MRRTEKRRTRAVVAGLLSDPYRKLAAVALAIGLWFFLDNQIDSTVRVRMKLEVVDSASGAAFEGGRGSRLLVYLPTDVVAAKRFVDVADPTQAIGEVELEIRGKKYVVERIDADRLVLPMRSLLERDWEEADAGEFTVDDLQLVRELQDTTISMRPSRVRLEVEKIDYHDLQLDLELVHLDADERLLRRVRRETAEFQRETVRILGPASQLADFRSGDKKPFVARLRGGTNKKQVMATLELDVPKDSPLRLQEETSMTVALQPEMNVFELELPVFVDDLALPEPMQGKLRPVQKRMRVRVAAAGDLRTRLVFLTDYEAAGLASWAAAHLRLVVWLPPEYVMPEPGERRQMPARLEVNGPVREQIEPSDYGLADSVPVTLQRVP